MLAACQGSICVEMFGPVRVTISHYGAPIQDESGAGYAAEEVNGPVRVTTSPWRNANTASQCRQPPAARAAPGAGGRAATRNAGVHLAILI